MRISAVLLFLLIVAGCQTTNIGDAALPASGFLSEPMTLHVDIQGKKYALDGLMIRRKGAAKLPLAVMTHGSCGSGCRARRSPADLQHQANVFADWGYATFILMRRDNGKSDGPYAEDFGGCDTQDYEGAANASADDLVAAIQYLKKLPYVDPAEIIAIGQSGGGIGVVALAARNIPGLNAAINFSGGRGGGCIRNSLYDETKGVAAFTAFGRTARTPTLWVYSKSDHYWGTERPRTWSDAYRNAGGTIEFAHLPPQGEKGHSFFYKKSRIPAWSPTVSEFLRQLGLPAAGSILPPR